MYLLNRLLLLISIQISFQRISQTQPVLIVPAGYFMESAGLNHEGDIVTIASGKLNVWDLDSLRLRYSVKFDTKQSYNAHYSALEKSVASLAAYRKSIPSPL